MASTLRPNHGLMLPNVSAPNSTRQAMPMMPIVTHKLSIP